MIGRGRTPFSATCIVDDYADKLLLSEVAKGTDAVIHTAALPAAPQNVLPDSELIRINIDGPRLVVEAARESKVERLVFTSTTAAFGKAVEDGIAAWVTDETRPQPRSIYHQTKLQAEALLQRVANSRLVIRVLRMSPADLMAIYA